MLEDYLAIIPYSFGGLGQLILLCWLADGLSSVVCILMSCILSITLKTIDRKCLIRKIHKIVDKNY